jgi:hypothetical protein
MFWDERYAEPGFAYGTEPNDHLANHLHLIPPGPVLLPADGEGRNGVAVAAAGHPVCCVDQSSVGLQKAHQLAQERGVHIETITADLASYTIEPNAWSGVVLIFCHLPPPLRKKLHAACVQALTPGGVLILEAYTPAQLAHNTGGPRDHDLLMTLDLLREELDGLTMLHAAEVTRHIREGRYHDGLSATVQIVAQRPL